MNINEETRENQSDDIDLIGLLKVFWDYKLSIIIILTLFSILSVFYSLSLPNKYQSSALLTVISESNQQSALNQFGGIAGIAGIAIPQESNKAQVGIEVLKSRSFIEDFIERRGIKDLLMASTGWDRETNKIIFDDELFLQSKSEWVKEDGITIEPSIHKTYDFWMKEIFTYEEDLKTGFITVRLEYFSPYLAKEWLDLLMHDLNNFMRDRDVREAELSIEYLNNEVSGTKSEALKDVFYNLIKTNTEKKMLAFSREDYLFRIIDPPIAPEEKSSPNRPLICILGFLLGLMFSFIYVLFMNYIFRNSEK
tara:strand:+ start:1079 stop:2005 length:927 start_codon:yes stop_codon:yes gene_type:complete